MILVSPLACAVQGACPDQCHHHQRWVFPHNMAVLDDSMVSYHSHMYVMLLQMALVSIPPRQQASTGRGQRGVTDLSHQAWMYHLISHRYT